MKKEIKDYLHLYLGCRFVMKIKNTEELTDDMIFGVDALNVAIYPYHPEDKIHPILILRPLSDMTEEEGIEIMNKIYESIYGHTGEFGSVEKVREYESVGFITHTKKYKERVSVTIEIERGIEFYIGGSCMKVNQFDITHYLLSKHFDLFGLIESGIAIDKTTLK